MKKPAAIAANMIRRVTVFSMSIAFVIQAYADHAHHTIASTSVGAHEALDARVLEDERGHLSEREDEHEVEEELDVAGLPLLFGRA